MSLSIEKHEYLWLCQCKFMRILDKKHCLELAAVQLSWELRNFSYQSHLLKVCVWERVSQSNTHTFRRCVSLSQEREGDESEERERRRERQTEREKGKPLKGIFLLQFHNFFFHTNTKTEKQIITYKLQLYFGIVLFTLLSVIVSQREESVIQRRSSWEWFVWPIEFA